MALADPDGDPGLNPLQQLHERLRTLPQVTIAKLRGRLRAGGGARNDGGHVFRRSR
jgi:hypothetical protein